MPAGPSAPEQSFGGGAEPAGLVALEHGFERKQS